MNKNRVNHTLQQASLIMLLTAIITKIIGALFKIPLSQDFCLGDLGFGYFSSAYDLYTPISTLAISGFPLALSQIIAEYTAENDYCNLKEALKCSKKVLFYVSVIEFILISAIIYPFSVVTDKTGEGIYSLIAILPAVIISSFLSFYRGYFEGFVNMLPPAISNIIEAFGKLILGFSFAFFILKRTNNLAFAAAGALLGISFGLIISTLYIYVKYKDDIKKIDFNKYSKKTDINKKLISKRIFKTMISFGLSSLAVSFVALIDTLTVRTQISLLLNDNSNYFIKEFNDLIFESNISSIEYLPTVLYGIKSKSFTLFNLTLTLAMSLGVGAVPIISKLKSQNKINQLYINANTSLKTTTLITFPVAFGFIFIGNKIMNLLFGVGQSSEIGGKMLIIYGFATIFAGLSIVLGNILQGIGKANIVFKNIYFGIFLKIIFNIILTGILKLNIYGCCISTLICYLIIFILNIILFFRNFKKLPLLSIFLKPLIASVLCGIVAYFISSFNEKNIVIIFSIFSAAVVYFVCLVLLKFFEPQDFESLPIFNKFSNMCK